VYAYLHNDDAPDVANPHTSSDDRPKSDMNSVHSYSSAFIDTDVQHSLIQEQSSDVNIPAKKARTVGKRAAVKNTTACDNSSKDSQRVEGTMTASSRWTLLSASSSVSSSQVSTCSTNETSDSQSSSRVPTDIGQEDYLLCPGSFRVLLCVDNQEFYAKYVCFCII